MRKIALNRLGSDKISYCFEMRYRVGTSKTPLGVGLKGEERDSTLRYLTMIG